MKGIEEIGCSGGGCDVAARDKGICRKQEC
jgi:hypothetical protein